MDIHQQLSTMQKIISFCSRFTLISLGIYITSVSSNPPPSLRLVQMIYRHGDRTPTKVYPTDPYQADFWPQGLGQLTTEGMRQQYELGRYLRRRYNGFLNETYKVDEIYVRSSDRDRALMSAYSNLAGLYPPKGQQVWSNTIRWQPIPVHTIPLEEDGWMSTSASCPGYDVMMNQLMNSTEATELYQKNKAFIDMITTKAGYAESTIQNAWNIQNPVSCERFHNLTLPAWITQDVWQKIDALKTKKYGFRFKTKEMNRIKSGLFMKMLAEQTESKVQNRTNPKRKMFMYSSHDTTIGGIMTALGIWNDIKPPYAAVLLFELHEMKPSDFRMKILYRNDTSRSPYLLKLPGCGVICPVQTFIETARAMEISHQEYLAKCGIAKGNCTGTGVVTVVDTAKNAGHTGCLPTLVILVLLAVEVALL